MAITNIKVSNFKSFKDLDLNLGRFNVVVGANASGKSNFVEVFRFLKTLEDEDLADAVSLHGGRESILNKKLGPAECLRMRATSDRRMAWGGAWADIRVHETTYDFRLHLGDAQDPILIEDDRFVQKLRLTGNGEDIELRLESYLSEGERKLEIGPPDVVDYLANRADASENALIAFQKYHRATGGAKEMRSAQGLLINHRFFGFMGMKHLFADIGVYDVEPHEVKRPHGKAGRVSLERNGENLALVLQNILADPEKSRKFHNLLQYMLPFAKEVGVEQYLGVSLLLKLREEYYDGSLLANLLSDGTVDVVALIVALFFEDKDVVIIEEPERNIHPHLISALMRLMEDAARNKQIIITTHSPEIVRHAGVENLLLMSRDKDGFSAISRPAEKEGVRIFLKNELGLDELFVQNALSV
jgi:predicted ATPase